MRLPYDPNFIVHVNYREEIADLSQLVYDAIPNAKQVSIRHLTDNNNRIIFHKNTSFDANNKSVNQMNFPWFIEFMFMHQIQITEDVMQKQIEIAVILSNALESAEIEFEFDVSDVVTLMSNE